MNYVWGELSRAEPIAPRLPGAVCMVARGETLPGFEDAFEVLLSDFAETVRADEPGCIAYAATRAVGATNHFAVHARFSCWRAFQRHGITQHMRDALPRLTALLATPVSLEVFLEV